MSKMEGEHKAVVLSVAIVAAALVAIVITMASCEMDVVHYRGYGHFEIPPTPIAKEPKP